MRRDGGAPHNRPRTCRAAGTRAMAADRHVDGRGPGRGGGPRTANVAGPNPPTDSGPRPRAAVPRASPQAGAQL
jgi:hypothetical protein